MCHYYCKCPLVIIFYHSNINYWSKFILRIYFKNLKKILKILKNLKKNFEKFKKNFEKFWENSKKILKKLKF